MRTHDTAALLEPCPWRGVLFLLLLVAALACEWTPVVNEGVQKRVVPGSNRIERTLDSSGARVLVSRQGAAGGRVYTITRWFTNAGCDLPEDTQRVFDVLLPAEPTRGSDTSLSVPLARNESGTLTLWLADERCRLSGPLASLDLESVSVFSSLDDGRGLLTFEDDQHSLYALDPARSATPTLVAREVAEVRRVVASVGGTLEDAFWLREGGTLSHRSFAGELLIQLGQQVSEFALYDGLSPRVAYVDGGDLYEAMPPSYQPTRRAQGACAPRYGASVLDMHQPCAAQQLVRMALATELFESFAPGTRGSRTLGELRFEHTRTDEGEQLFVEAESLARTRIEPLLLLDSLSLVQTRRVLGRTATGEVGSWHLATQRFEPLFTRVSEVTAHTDGESGVVHWLVHHDESEGLGSLSVLRVADLNVRRIASLVPTAARAGYQLVPHAALGKLRSPEPLLLYLHEAGPLDADVARMRGRLSGTLLMVDTPMELAEQVSSYAFVGEPFPGLLVGIEAGARKGIWVSGL